MTRFDSYLHTACAWQHTQHYTTEVEQFHILCLLNICLSKIYAFYAKTVNRLFLTTILWPILIFCKHLFVQRTRVCRACLELPGVSKVFGGAWPPWPRWKSAHFTTEYPHCRLCPRDTYSSVKPGSHYALKQAYPRVYVHLYSVSGCFVQLCRHPCLCPPHIPPIVLSVILSVSICGQYLCCSRLHCCRAAKTRTVQLVRVRCFVT